MTEKSFVFLPPYHLVPATALLWLASCASPPPPPLPSRAAPSPPPAAPTAASSAGEPVPPKAPAASCPAKDDPTFVPVSGFDGAFVVRAIPAATRVSVAPPSACALTREGAVYCFRYPHSVDTLDEPPFPTRPSAIEGLASVSDISAGAGGVCTLGAAIHCVGNTLGDHRMPPDAHFLSVGVEHACAVRQAGGVSCWGEGSFGRLGMPSATERADVPGLGRVQEVSAGRFGTCAVQSPGTLVCWGAASLIPWAPGGTGWTPPKPTGPTILRGIHDVAHVSLRGVIPCLMRKTGRVLCWTPEDAATLLPQNPLPKGSEVRGIDDAVAISGSLVVRRSGALAAVELVIEEDEGAWFAARPIGERVLTDVIDADGSREHGCAVRRGGEVICWGVCP